MYHQVKHNRGW